MTTFKRAGIHCPDCNSSDALTLYEEVYPMDGTKKYHTFCFSCGATTLEKDFRKKPGFEEIVMSTIGEEQDEIRRVGLSADSGCNIKRSPTEGLFSVNSVYRGVYESVLRKFEISFKYSGDNTEVEQHRFQYHDKHGNPVAEKIRSDDKEFFTFNGKVNEAVLFGQQLFPAGGKYITVCEGEWDAPSAYQMMGEKYPFVSVKTGSKGGEKDCRKSFKYLNSFQEIRICFDPDKAGREGMLKVVKLFDKHKVKIIKLDPGIGDPNDYLQKGKINEFVRAFWSAENYRPDEIIPIRSLKEQVRNRPRKECFSYPWNSLNKMTYGMRFGELDTWIAGTGSGKTSFIKEIVYHLLRTTDHKIGMIMLEEPDADTVQGILSLHLGRHLLSPDDNTPEHVWSAAFDEVFGKDGEQDNRLFVYSSEGSTNMENIFEAVEYLNVEEGCKFIFLDHISMITADQRYTDERAALDEIVNKLNKYVVDKELHITQIAHINRQGMIRGTAGIEQVSRKIIRLMRNKKHEDARLRNVTRLMIEKNRFNGVTGPAGFIEYNVDTTRLHEVYDVEMKELKLEE